MNRPGWAVIAGTAAYSFLFYEQASGINFFVFSVLLAFLLGFIKRDALKNPQWYLYASAVLFSSFFVLIYGSALAVFSTIISWLLLSAISFVPRATIPVSLLQAGFSIGGSIVFFTQKAINRFEKERSGEGKRGIRFLIYLVAFLLLVLFFFLYKKANPLFEKYTKEINLDFISIVWFIFTFGGFLLLCGLLMHERLSQLDVWEVKQEYVEPKPASASQAYLHRAFTALFIVLNLMLFFINALDLNFLYAGSVLPDGITHKEFVHNGVNNLIFSILLGIIIILYVYRSGRNDTRKMKIVRIVAYLWLFQNLLMTVSTGLRNHMYITDALLTYKRVGVYYWLTLAISGIITTFIKIKQGHTNWYLVRSNSIVGLFLLVASTCVDWDLVISRYNISRAHHLAALDKRYLLSLSEGNLPLLYPLRNKTGFETDSLYHYRFRRDEPNRLLADEKLYEILVNKHIYGDLRSYNFRFERAHDWIISNKHLVDTLHLRQTTVPDLRCLRQLHDLHTLSLPAWFNLNDSTSKEIAAIRSLRLLELGNLDEKYIPHIRNIPQLKVLRIRETVNTHNKELHDQLKARYPQLIISQEIH